MNQNKPKSWRENISIFWIGVVIAGPLALPLLWQNPKIARSKKLLITVVVLLISAVFVYLLGKQLNTIMELLQGRLITVSG